MGVAFRAGSPLVGDAASPARRIHHTLWPRERPVVGLSRGGIMTEMATETPALEDVGPIDYVVFQWQRERPGAAREVAPLLLDLVDRGIVRISTSRSSRRTMTANTRHL